MNTPPPSPDCRFCLANRLLSDSPVPATPHLFLLDSLDPALPAAVMVVPYRHTETPFDLTPEEAAELPQALRLARDRLARWAPEGFTIGWNVGAFAGQTVAHVHLHVIARKTGDPRPGKGLRGLLKAH